MMDPLESKLGGRARVLLPLMLLLFVAVSAWRMWPGTTPVAQRFHGETMGTTYNVSVVATALTDEARAAIERAIARELSLVDRQMSNYRPDSELSRVNTSGTGAVTVSRELLEVLLLAREISELSQGAYDVTVAPLVDAYGFGPGDAPGGTPEAARARVGYRRLRLDADASTVQKQLAALTVDLSSIAPGYAADRIAAALRELGHGDTMVEVGGEVRTSGVNAAGEPWRIAIERPPARDGSAPATRQVHTVLRLTGQGLATSGDYRQFRVDDGAWLSHTIDPRTGRPVAHALASVTVVADSAARADALATALSVLGPQEGLELAREHDVAALMLMRDGDGALTERTTPALDRLRNDAR